jgi:hypothetical protein
MSVSKGGVTIDSKDEFYITDDVFYASPHLATLVSWASGARSSHPLPATRLLNTPPPPPPPLVRVTGRHSNATQKTAPLDACVVHSTG